MSDRRRFATFAILLGAGPALICCAAPLLAGTMAFALSAFGFWLASATHLFGVVLVSLALPISFLAWRGLRRRARGEHRGGGYKEMGTES